MRLAERITRLGTETAFAVSAEANELKAEGRTVYPFHLGDINLATPGTVVQGAIDALHRGKTGYCPNAGIPELREALAQDVNSSRGTSFTADNVAVQPGGKPVISKFLLSSMNPGDEVLYPNPGFPIYESQIEFLGGKAVPYGFLATDSGFQLDLDGMRRAISPDTRLLILNDMHNPTGAECSDEELQAVAELAAEHDLLVLADEAYFDIRFEGRSRSLASFPNMEERCLILYTFSKRFAMTGWRLGAAIGPKKLIEVITRLNVNQESCSSHFLQYGAVAGLQGDQNEVQAILETLRERRDVAVEGLSSIPGITCHKPRSTFYLFPRVTPILQTLNMDLEAFRKDVLQSTGVSFCARHHFGRPKPGEDAGYLRLAYSGIDADQIDRALEALAGYVRDRT
jgi:aspartate/methionine/tyrosine aminotransferase